MGTVVSQTTATTSGTTITGDASSASLSPTSSSSMPAAAALLSPRSPGVELDLQHGGASDSGVFTIEEEGIEVPEDETCLGGVVAFRGGRHNRASRRRNIENVQSLA